MIYSYYIYIFMNPENAIKREKQIKNYSRKKKEELITLKNPQMNDICGEIVY